MASELVSPSSAPHKHVVIVGGSLAGLMAGVMLGHLGREQSQAQSTFSITVLERSRSPLLHDQGAGIVASGDTQEFFRRYGNDAMHARPLAVDSRLRQYLDRGGAQIDREDRAQRMTSWGLLYNVLRANFDARASAYGDEDGDEDAGVGGGRDGGGGANGVEAHGRVPLGRCEHDADVTGLELTDPENPAESRVVVTYTKSGIDGDSGERITKQLVADLVIGADGPSSGVRRLVAPSIERRYVGYVAWRGTLPESQLSAATAASLVETITFFHSAGVQAIAYVIPGRRGMVERGRRLLNWCWYRNAAAGSAEHAEVMTDGRGRRHRWTVPQGSVDADLWTRVRAEARATLPPQFAEVVAGTEAPFVQAISDVVCRRAVYHGGKVLLVGDALAGFRPHTAGSTGQAAFDVMALERMLRGEIGMEEWEKTVMERARKMYAQGVWLGDRSQFGRHPLMVD